MKNNLNNEGKTEKKNEHMKASNNNARNFKKQWLKSVWLTNHSSSSNHKDAPYLVWMSWERPQKRKWRPMRPHPTCSAYRSRRPGSLPVVRGQGNHRSSILRTPLCRNIAHHFWLPLHHISWWRLWRLRAWPTPSGPRCSWNPWERRLGEHRRH